MLRLLLALSLSLSLSGGVQRLCAAVDTGASHAILIVSSEGLRLASVCELGLYLQDQLVARLYQEQSVSLSWPPGETLASLKPLGSPACQVGMPVPHSQRLLLKAGSINHFRITPGASGPYLTPMSGGQ
jgi:hypothetical protein